MDEYEDLMKECIFAPDFAVSPVGSAVHYMIKGAYWRFSSACKFATLPLRGRMTTVIAYVYVLIRVCTRRGLCGLSARSAILYVWAWAFCCLSFSKAMRRPACGISEIQTPAPFRLFFL